MSAAGSPRLRSAVLSPIAVTQIPLDPPRSDGGAKNGSSQSARPPWIRPVRKKTSSVSAANGRSPNGSGDSPSHHSSPESFSEFFGEAGPLPGSVSGGGGGQGQAQGGARLYGMDSSGMDVYMSPVDVMASFFGDGGPGGVGLGMGSGVGMEVGLFGPEMGEP